MTHHAPTTAEPRSSATTDLMMRALKTTASTNDGMAKTTPRGNAHFKKTQLHLNRASPPFNLGASPIIAVSIPAKKMRTADAMKDAQRKMVCVLFILRQRPRRTNARQRVSCRRLLDSIRSLACKLCNAAETGNDSNKAIMAYRAAATT